MTTLWLALATLVAAVSTRAPDETAAPLPAMRSLAVVPVGEYPAALAFAAEGRAVLVATVKGGRIDIIDVDSRRAVDRLTAPESPVGIVRDAEGRLLVTDFSGDRLLVLDGRTYATLEEITTGAYPAVPSSPAWDGRTHVPVVGGVAAALLGGDVVAWRPGDAQPAPGFEVGGAPLAALLSPSRTKLWVSCYMAGELAVRDLLAGRSLPDLELGSRVAGAAFTEDGAHLIVAVQGEGEVVVVNTETHEVVQRLEDVGAEPVSVTVTGGWAFVSEQDEDRLVALDARSVPLRVVERLDVGDGPWFAVVHPTRDELWVSLRKDDAVEVVAFTPHPERAARTPADHAQTEVVVLPTIGARHLASTDYPLERLAELLAAVDPDVVVAELQPALTAAGRLDDPLQPAYAELVVAWTRARGVPLEPASPWTGELAAFRADALHRFRSSPEHAEAHAAWVAALGVLEGRSPWLDEDPLVLASREHRERMAVDANLDEHHRGAVLGPASRRSIARGAWEAARRGIDRHPGRRVLVLSDVAHAHALTRAFQDGELGARVTPLAAALDASR